MTFRQLELFLLIVRLGTISAAAKSLGVTQSGASRLLSELEKNTGFDLFFRSAAGIELTEQGRAFHAQVERQFSGMDSLKEAVRSIREGLNQRLRIACLPTLATAILPGAITRFHDKRPEMGIEIETTSYSSALDLLAKRRVDIAFTFLMPELNGTAVEMIADAAYVFALNENHPLTSKTEISSQDLYGLDIAGLLPNAIMDQNADGDTTQRAKLEENANIKIWCHTSATRYAMVAAGKIATIAEPFSAPLFRSAGVKTLPLKPRISLKYGVATPSDQWFSPEISDFRNALREEVHAFSDQEGLDFVFRP
ncbi:LysR family transcriptional regulator [Yoonia sp. R2331]|uniref:LysR family transcriptional regulator n=1 Tax=Yoonia sp. R2331 TaxID=3237238 RepID=UPI0034E56E53